MSGRTHNIIKNKRFYNYSLIREVASGHPYLVLMFTPIYTLVADLLEHIYPSSPKIILKRDYHFFSSDKELQAHEIKVWGSNKRDYHIIFTKQKKIHI